ncbi:hypothetical protein F5883DRAFT_708562 [Diaporthe sp. PMI_573]|nr:hypothetical protein F5883DRAFT_708562 [Diaporthaceae sp. PMI_573]
MRGINLVLALALTGPGLAGPTRRGFGALVHRQANDTATPPPPPAAASGAPDAPPPPPEIAPRREPQPLPHRECPLSEGSTDFLLFVDEVGLNCLESNLVLLHRPQVPLELLHHLLMLQQRRHRETCSTTGRRFRCTTATTSCRRNAAPGTACWCRSSAATTWPSPNASSSTPGSFERTYAAPPQCLRATYAATSQCFRGTFATALYVPLQLLSLRARARARLKPESEPDGGQLRLETVSTFETSNLE